MSNSFRISTSYRTAYPSHALGVIVFFWALVSLPLVTEAESINFPNPFDGISEIALDIHVDGSFDSDSRIVLFSGYLEGKETFQRALAEDLELLLGEAGIKSDLDVEDSLSVVVWGHQEMSSGGDSIHVFLVEVEVTDVDFAIGDKCEPDLTYEMRAVGVATTDELVSTLRRETLRLVEGLLSSRETEGSRAASVQKITQAGSGPRFLGDVMP